MVYSLMLLVQWHNVVSLLKFNSNLTAYIANNKVLYYFNHIVTLVYDMFMFYKNAIDPGCSIKHHVLI